MSDRIKEIKEKLDSHGSLSSEDLKEIFLIMLANEEMLSEQQ